jgi:hypothetical protein
LEHAGAGDEGAVDLEEGVLRRRTDQDDGAVLDPGQEGVLLGLVPAMDLVDEEDRAPVVELAVLAGLVDGDPDVGDPRKDRVERYEAARGRIRDNPGQGRLPRARGVPRG